MEALYKAYKDNKKVEIFLVYVNEAHPAKQKTADPANKSFQGVGKHENIEEKVLAASKCMEGLKLTLPIVIDGMDGAAEKAYSGRPAATAVVDLAGKIAFHSVGSSGVQPKKADKVIKQLLGSSRHLTTRPAGTSIVPPTIREPQTRPTSRPAKTPEHAFFEKFTAGAGTEGNTSTYGGVMLIRDIAYRQGSSEKFKLDLAMPSESSASSRPAVVLVHGGGWDRGDKGAPFVQGGALLFAKRGYVCINVNYRLSGEAPFPAAFEDVKCAVRWLRANAKKFKVDPNRIGAVGVSAGGHLVAMLGLAASAPGIGSDSPYERYSSGVQAVAAVCAPTDLTGSISKKRSVSAFLAGPEETAEERQKAASPITYVSKDAPPFLIVHGAADETVPVKQSETFARVLRDAGAKDVTYRRIDGVGHAVDKHPGVREAVDAFFDKTLKQPKSSRKDAPNATPSS